MYNNRLYKSFNFWISAVGVILASLSIFHLCIYCLKMPLSEFGKLILQGYESVFHRIIDYLFFWVPLLFEIDIPKILKSYMTIWLLMSGMFYRSIKRFAFEESRNQSVIGRVYAHFLLILGSLILSPIMLWAIFYSIMPNHSKWLSSDRKRKRSPFFFEFLKTVRIEFLAVLLSVTFLAASNHGLYAIFQGK